MTKKDYELIASGIKKALNTWTPDTKERESCIYAIIDTALTISQELQQENERFKPNVFLTACGIDRDSKNKNWVKAS